MGSWMRLDGNVRRTRVRAMASTASAASGDGGDDRHLIAALQSGLLAVEEADVLFVDVDVDEASQLPRLVHQAVSQARELPFEVVDKGADGVGRGLDLGVAPGDRAQRGRNANENGHPRCLLMTESSVT